MPQPIVLLCSASMLHSVLTRAVVFRWLAATGDADGFIDVRGPREDRNRLLTAVAVCPHDARCGRAWVRPMYLEADYCHSQSRRCRGFIGRPVVL